MNGFGRQAADVVVGHLPPFGQGLLVIGLGGPVSVGKSTLAAEISARLDSAGLTSTIVGTDGFLFPNDVLIQRGSIDRKGEPDTYDEAALASMVALARQRPPTITVPSYSHRTFDVLPARSVALGSVLLVEGVNAMQPGLAGMYDLGVYLDAPLDAIIEWYVERFLRLIEESETDAASFYRRFVDLDLAGRHEMAHWVWDSINLPNLDRFIAPTKGNADLVLVLGNDHSLVSVEHQEAPQNTRKHQKHQKHQG